MKIIAYTLVFWGLFLGSCSSNTNSNSNSIAITGEPELAQTIAETANESVLTIEELRLKVNESSFAIDELEGEIEALLKTM